MIYSFHLISLINPRLSSSIAASRAPVWFNLPSTAQEETCFDMIGMEISWKQLWCNGPMLEGPCEGIIWRVTICKSQGLIFKGEYLLTRLELEINWDKS